MNESDVQGQTSGNKHLRRGIRCCVLVTMGMWDCESTGTAQEEEVGEAGKVGTRQTTSRNNK